MIINCIGDITGYGKTLVELYNQLPTGELWALGDIVDRGPNSKLALDFLIDGGHNAVMGNHDHMMLFERIQEEKMSILIYIIQMIGLKMADRQLLQVLMFVDQNLHLIPIMINILIG